MLYFKLNKVPYTIPTKWEEVNVATFQRIASLEDNYQDEIKLLCALIDIEETVLLNSTDSIREVKTAALKLVANNAPFSDIPKDEFTYKGTTYKTPHVEMQMIGQKEMLQSRLRDSTPSSCIAYAVALYLQPLIDGKFEREAIEVLEQELLYFPALEVYPVALFFLRELRKYKQLGNAGFNPFL